MELSQLKGKHKFLVRPKVFTITSSTVSVSSKDVFLFLWSKIKSDLLEVPAPSPSLSRRGVKGVCSPDTRQAARQLSLALCGADTV